MIGKYGAEDDPLYPKDLLTRARIDQRLQFDTAVLFAAVRKIVDGFLFGGLKELSVDTIVCVHSAYDLLETFLSTSKFLVGDHRTVADYSIIATVAQIAISVPINSDKYPKLSSWVEGFDEVPFYHEINTSGIKDLKKILDMVIARNRDQ